MNKRILLFIAGPLLCFAFQVSPYQLIGPEADKVFGVALWMVLWWITEPVSIAVTALIPLTFFPLFDIMGMKEVAANYGHPIVFLFFGGFIMALTLEKVMLHKRIALHIIKLTGTSPNMVILGFILATAFLSMWISNTATTIVMLPIAYSVIQLLMNDSDGFSGNDKNFALSIMLGIAYSANVGGIATLIGTPPNIILAGYMESEYGYSISFLNWMIIGVPFAVVMLMVIYLVLTKIMYPNKIGSFEKSSSIIDDEIKKLGPLIQSEKIVLIIFVLTILLWVGKNLLNDLLPGLSLSDTTISLLAAFACFTILSKGQLILAWENTKKLPWGIIILFGGGLALASALSNAGLIILIGDLVSSNEALSVILICSILISVVLFMTELMSNVALVAVFAPMIAGVATGLDINLLHIFVPIAMASSCAFMLPMATPPNAIVFASGHIKIIQMVKAGIILNLFAIVLLLVFFNYFIPLVFTF